LLVEGMRPDKGGCDDVVSLAALDLDKVHVLVVLRAWWRPRAIVKQCGDALKEQIEPNVSVVAGIDSDDVQLERCLILKLLVV